MSFRDLILALFLTIGLANRLVTGMKEMDVSRTVDEQKRQHWTASLKPGGKRSFSVGGNEFEISLHEDEIEEPSLDDLDALRYWVSTLSDENEVPVSKGVLDKVKRQHWTTGLSPGGKRGYDDKRQHWTSGLSPGGKRNDVGKQKRQHWTVGLSPGGKRSQPIYEEKRQHWTVGLSPGGKRSQYQNQDDAAEPSWITKQNNEIQNEELLNKDVYNRMEAPRGKQLAKMMRALADYDQQDNLPERKLEEVSDMFASESKPSHFLDAFDSDSWKPARTTGDRDNGDSISMR